QCYLWKDSCPRFLCSADCRRSLYLACFPLLPWLADCLYYLCLALLVVLKEHPNPSLATDLNFLNRLSPRFAGEPDPVSIGYYWQAELLDRLAAGPEAGDCPAADIPVDDSPGLGDGNPVEADNRAGDNPVDTDSMVDGRGLFRPR